MPHTRDQDRATRILIADDDGVSRLFCSQSLALPGVRILLAGSGAAATHTAAAHFPHVVVMDAHLQDMSGAETIERIRDAWPISSPAPCFIGMTADDSPAAVCALRAAGCQHVLIKPFSSQSLSACVREAVGSDPDFQVRLPTPNERQAAGHLQARFLCSLPPQLVELDGAMTRLDWEAVRRVVHALSGAAAMAGYGAVTRSGQALLRRLPPAGAPLTVADYYVVLLQQLAEIPPA